MLSIETIRLKFRNKVFIPLTAKTRHKRLSIKDFTIISNNCWGGTIYESYGVQKASPTVGMFIMPDDYLMLIENLEYYLKQELVFIEPIKSKWLSQLSHKDNWGKYLIGKLGDIELHMLHYHDENVARKKWMDRIERVNWDKIIYKFNDQNGCKREHIERFLGMELKNKLCFVSKVEFKVSDDVILIRQPARYRDGIKASREPFGKTCYIDITSYLNNI